MACEGLMAQVANVELLQPTPAQRATFRNATIILARAMEEVQTILRGKLKVPVIFVSLLLDSVIGILHCSDLCIS